MNWAAIIATLINTLIPILTEWLSQWLDTKLKSAASSLGKKSFGTNEKAVAALFDTAIGDTPRFAFGRRTLLRRLKASAVAQADTLAAGAFSLSPNEIDEISDAAGSAENE